MPFGSGRWMLWEHVVLRSAGFPANAGLRLAASDLAAEADTLRSSGDASAESFAAFESRYAAALEALQPQLRRIAKDSRFQHALAWQNHQALQYGAMPMAGTPAGPVRRNSRHRQREDLIAGYWQRYCLKNDSIGFFGPVGWVRIDRSAGTRFQPRREFLESHEIFFESWAIDQLAEVIGKTPGMAPWLAPRRLSYLGVDDAAVLPAGRPRKAVSPTVAQILRRCNGILPAVTLAADLVTAGAAASLDEVYSLLEDLRRRRWIVWELELPADPRPEVALRRRLEQIGSTALRDQSLSMLDRLEKARESVKEAYEDPERLLAALEHLDETFTDVVRGTPTRNAGKTYGGRTLVYHDARRALDVSLGRDLVDALAPLEMIFKSAAWLTHTVGGQLDQRIKTLRLEAGARIRRPVDLGTLWFECMSLIHGPGRDLVDTVVEDLQRRWAQVLHLPADVAHVAYTQADIEQAVDAQFGAPHSGWHGARAISPDLMIAADDVEAIRRGQFQVVLAELHLAIVSYRHHCFVSQHPDPEQLFACLDRDHPRPRLLPVLPKDNSARLTVRTHPALIRPKDFLVALYHHTVDPIRPRVLLSSDLPVHDDGERLTVRAPDGETFDVLECFSELLLDLVIDAFEMFPSGDHLPRVTIDRLVVNRETWWFSAPDLDFVDHRSEARRFLEVRAWRDAHRLSRCVFVTSPLEIKPFFVDFDSPVYLNLFIKSMRAVRKAESVGRVKLTEMLPTAEQLWLTDADGKRYTSELRLVAVDQRPTDTLLHESQSTTEM